MKKIITCIVAATAICLSASAQTEDNSREEQLEQELDDARTELDNLKLKQKYKEIWGKGRYTNLGYAIAQTGTDFDPVEKVNSDSSCARAHHTSSPANPFGAW